MSTDIVAGETCVTLCIEGQTLLLHPQRAVIWLERRTLIVADTHFGKSAIFRRHGIPVPAGSDEYDRARLKKLLDDTGAQRLIVLGDFLHAPIGIDSDDARDLVAFAESLPDTEIRVVAGNHDRGVIARWRPPVQWQESDLLEAPFRFTHDAGNFAGGDARGFTLSGHIHPVVRLTGARKLAPRVPIFWQRPGGLVLPSFGIFTGGYVVSPGSGDRVYAVGSRSVVTFR